MEDILEMIMCHETFQIEKSFRGVFPKSLSKLWMILKVFMFRSLRQMLDRNEMEVILEVSLRFQVRLVGGEEVCLDGRVEEQSLWDGSSYLLREGGADMDEHDRGIALCAASDKDREQESEAKEQTCGASDAHQKSTG